MIGRRGRAYKKGENVGEREPEGLTVSISPFIFLQSPTLLLVLVRSVPRPRNDFTASTHGLGVRAHHADSAHVVQDVFGSNRFSSNA